MEGHDGGLDEEAYRNQDEGGNDQIVGRMARQRASDLGQIEGTGARV